jgi:hypothetical protein
MQQQSSDNYSIDTETLTEVFERLNRMLPFLPLEWTAVVDGLDWCIRNHERVEIKSQFDNCYLRFDHNENGYVTVEMVKNSNGYGPDIVAKTVVGDFLSKVDGEDEDQDDDWD